MSPEMSFYVGTILIYVGVWLLGAWGLNLQFGTAGLLSFAFVIFQAAGAYTCAVLSLGPQTDNGGYQHYILGWAWPFPLPILGGVVAACVLAIPVGLVTLRRLRSDYQAVALLVISIIASSVATNETHLFNGAAGLSLVPKPFLDQLGGDLATWYWAYVGFVAVCCLIAYFIVHRLTNSPLGRALRAMRDNENAALALAKDITRLRLLAFVIGAGLAGFSGAIWVLFIGTWAPSAWFYPETFVFLAAILIGGSNNLLGVLVGVLLVPIAFAEATRFLPDIPGHPGLIDAFQWIAIGLLFLLFLWFRPQGIVPERKRRYAEDGRPLTVMDVIRRRRGVTPVGEQA